MSVKEKDETLRKIIAGYGNLVVAFSGGVDSTLVLAAALEALPHEKVLAVTFDVPFLCPGEVAAAREIADHLGAEWEVINFDVLTIPALVSNAVDRCYHCKRLLFSELLARGVGRGFAAVADGSNADDAQGYRPGRRATRDLGVESPLAAAGIGKAEARELLRRRGLPNWDKPAMPCLASRFPYDVQLTAEGLARVARAEMAVRQRGYRVVRVRDHYPLARLELGPEDLVRAKEDFSDLAALLLAAGYAYATLDLQGYRSGCYDEGLTEEKEGGK